ncbi:MAG TPA: hypothetical protein VFJ43_09420 [Bacteroidia bacterium]|nr:hypothetical protein [Bacteroidia bacterium]
MKFIRGILVWALFAFIYSGCKPEPTFPAVPALTFNRFIQPPSTDSLVVVCGFTDGDGDIGLLPTDTNYNMMLTVYAPDANGNYQVMDDLNTPQADSLIYKYRIPHLTAGQAGLEGDIYVALEHKSFIGRDTLEFNAFILDNSHHKSNVVRTSPVILTH